MIIPALRYNDSASALQFLQQVFGLTPGALVTNDDGSIAHAELWIGDGCVMIGQMHDIVPWLPEPGTGNVYAVVDDPDRHFDITKVAGADILVEPYDTDYGSREYSVRDVEGNVWSFGTYLPEPVSTQEP